jgi:hypothetical protein
VSGWIPQCFLGIRWSRFTDRETRFDCADILALEGKELSMGAQMNVSDLIRELVEDPVERAFLADANGMIVRHERRLDWVTFGEEPDEPDCA